VNLRGLFYFVTKAERERERREAELDTLKWKNKNYIHNLRYTLENLPATKPLLEWFPGLPDFTGDYFILADRFRSIGREDLAVHYESAVLKAIGVPTVDELKYKVCVNCQCLENCSWRISFSNEFEVPCWRTEYQPIQINKENKMKEEEQRRIYMYGCIDYCRKHCLLKNNCDFLDIIFLCGDSPRFSCQHYDHYLSLKTKENKMKVRVKNEFLYLHDFSAKLKKFTLGIYEGEKLNPDNLIAINGILLTPDTIRLNSDVFEIIEDWKPNPCHTDIFKKYASDINNYRGGYHPWVEYLTKQERALRKLRQIADHFNSLSPTDGTKYCIKQLSTLEGWRYEIIYKDYRPGDIYFNNMSESSLKSVISLMNNGDGISMNDLL